MPSVYDICTKSIYLIIFQPFLCACWGLWYCTCCNSSQNLISSIRAHRNQNLKADAQLHKVMSLLQFVSEIKRRRFYASFLIMDCSTRTNIHVFLSFFSLDVKRNWNLVPVSDFKLTNALIVLTYTLRNLVSKKHFCFIKKCFSGSSRTSMNNK